MVDDEICSLEGTVSMIRARILGFSYFDDYSGLKVEK